MNSEYRIKGISISDGIAIGKLLKIGRKKEYTEKGTQALNLFYSLREALLSKIKSIKDIPRETQELFDIYEAILNDPYFENLIKDDLLKRKFNLTEAMENSADVILNLLSQGNRYIKERARDIKRLISVLQSASLGETREDVIVYNDDLEIIDFVGMDMNRIKGIVTLNASKISHIAIWARGRIIPFLYSVNTRKLSDGQLAILDSRNGVLILNPSKKSLVEARREKLFFETVIEKSRKFKKQLIEYRGGSITIAANIGNVEEAYEAYEQGAEGIGLFRTEFIFLSRSVPPSEEEQFSVYSEVAGIFDSPVIIRTMDIGGDKRVDYLDSEEGRSTFLGLRGLRLSLDRTDLFRTQIRALLRAAGQHSNIRIMFPMVTIREEFQKAKEIVHEVSEDLKKENKSFGSPQIGIMVEVPACALNADKFSELVDFMSIGTNDLIQYTMAMDRTDRSVGYLYLPHNNAIVNLISNVVVACRKRGKWVGMCGAMASDIVYYPLLLEIGLDEFSVVPSRIPIIKMYHSYLVNRGFPSLLPWDESKVDILRQLVDRFWQWAKGK